LAAWTAHQLQSSFADGILWGNPHTSDPMTILDLWGKGYAHDFSGLADIESRSAAMRTLLTDKETLIVLDNVDDAALARPLLPSGRQCAVMLASRNLDVALALDAKVVEIAPLSGESSLTLLKKIVGTDRVEAEIEAANRIVEILHHLPLAVEIAGKRLKSRARMTLHSMAERLESTQHRLGLSIGDQAVRTSFQVSWEGLSQPLRETFSGMALFNGHPFRPPPLSAVINKDLYDVEDELDRLASLSLVSEYGETRYQQHPLLVDFAAEKLDNTSIKQERYLDYYLSFAKESRERFEQLEPEWPNISAALRIAEDQEEWETVLALADQLATSWLRYGRYPEAEKGYAAALRAAQALGSDLAEAHTLLRWAEIEIEQSQYDAAWKRLTRAEQLFYSLEDSPGIARTHYFQGFIRLDQGEYAQANEVLQTSRRLQAELGDPLAEAETVNLMAYLAYETEETLGSADQFIAKTLELLGPDFKNETTISILKLKTMSLIRSQAYAQATAVAEETLALSIQLKKPVEIGDATRLLAIILMREGRYHDAEPLALEALDQFQRLGNRRFEGMVLYRLAQIYFHTGRVSAAEEETQKSLEIYEEIKDRLGYGWSLAFLGEIHLKKEEEKKAAAAWHETLTLATLLNNPSLETHAEQQLSKLDR
ncbi:MAG: tetratricopeptide repeat protein, partial [Chloroflexota bacterium]